MLVKNQTLNALKDNLTFKEHQFFIFVIWLWSTVCKLLIVSFSNEIKELN